MKYPRGRMPYPKSGQIKVGWAAERGDDPGLIYCRKGPAEMSRDTLMLTQFFQQIEGRFGRTLEQELIERGYDISTFRFSIDKLPEPDAPEAPTP